MQSCFSQGTLHFAADDYASQCLFVVTAPNDAEVYGCFRGIARRWRDRLSAENLTIQGDVPISPGFLLDAPPAPIYRLTTANMDLISSIELEFGDLRLWYARTGGHGPTMFRESFFDEVRIHAPHSDGCPAMIDLIGALDARLQISAAMVSDELSDLTKHTLTNCTTVHTPLDN